MERGVIFFSRSLADRGKARHADLGAAVQAAVGRLCIFVHGVKPNAEETVRGEKRGCVGEHK